MVKRHGSGVVGELVWAYTPTFQEDLSVIDVVLASGGGYVVSAFPEFLAGIQ